MQRSQVFQKAKCPDGRKCLAALPALLLLLLVGSPLASAGTPSVTVNTWVKLKTTKNGNMWNNMVWSPTRGQLLHFNGLTVMAFDADKNEWIDDYAWPGKKKSRPGCNWKGPAKFGKEGMPPPINTLSGLCWDSKRKRMVLTVWGTMAAYDPESKKWSELKAKTELYGKASAGGPPVFSTGVCYDPVNDEILMQPHFSGPGCPKNRDREEVDGRLSSHLGTLRFSFKDMTWRRVSDSFGSPEIKEARKQVLGLMTLLSKASDKAYILRRIKGVASADEILKSLSSAAESTGKVAGVLPPRARTGITKAVPHIRASVEASRAGKWDAVIASCGKALWELDLLIEESLRVEPFPRCAAQMTYDPVNQAIVLFGGHSNLTRTDLDDGREWCKYWALDDTWIYDCKTRQWKQVAVDRRPPGQRMPLVAYDPVSKQIVMVALKRARKGSASSQIWTLDVAKGAWSKRGELPWPGPLSTGSGHGSESPKPYVPLQKCGLDLKHGKLIVVQPEKKKGGTYAMRLDLAKMPAEPAPKWKAPPPIRPQVVPADDPAWVSKLKSLPANKWVAAKPGSREASNRGWGTAACDPVRGHVYYFGGGHSTYQINDVAIYVTGANKWVHTVGEHNDYIPWQGWGGVAMSPRGGRPACHQRNTYIALDGRMFVGSGGTRWYTGYGSNPPDQRVGYPWFYDLDRGGVWRRIRAELKKDEGLKPYSAVAMVAPDGRVLGTCGEPAGYYGKGYRSVHSYAYDIYRNNLTLKKVEMPYPLRRIGGEGRKYCFMADTNRFFYYDGQDTWIFDFKSNAFRNMKANGQPAGNHKAVSPRTVEYLDQQGVVYAIIGKGEQWGYSPKRNAWAKLTDEMARGCASPYAQVVYVARYGVLVCVAGRKTRIMRPDFSKADWTSSTRKTTSEVKKK